MDRAFSVYLDLVRFGAACLVYMYHSNQRLLSTAILPASNYGHSSVIVFFVLSGFVIAYITETKEYHWARYASSRISRVYSVAVPAVVMTVGLDALGRYLYPALYAYPFDNFVVRIGASAFLLNEIWFVSITSFSNVPYWSICYEWWYYVAFALVTFLPRRLGYTLTTLLAVLLGPKIILLAPLWAAGVILFRWTAIRSLPPTLSWLMVFGSLIGIYAFHSGNVEAILSEWVKGLVGPEWHKELTFSKFFLGDYILGSLVFANFAGVRGVANTLAPLFRLIERPVKILAGYTFTLYLLHQPLFLFWAAVIRGDPAGYLYWWATTVLVALSVGAIGFVTENKRHLLRRWIESRLSWGEQFVLRRRILNRPADR